MIFDDPAVKISLFLLFVWYRYNGRDRSGRFSSIEHSKDRRKESSDNERSEYLTRDRDSKEKSPEDFKLSPQPREDIGSWADEVDNEESYEHEKTLGEARRSEDREKSPREQVHRRIFVFQKKVENMTSEKVSFSFLVVYIL